MISFASDFGGNASRAATGSQPTPGVSNSEVQLRDYEILGFVGRGSQAGVYKAVQQSTGRLVALKILDLWRDTDSATRRRFEQEILIVAGLNHPNIVPIYDSGVTENGWPYFAMPFLDGVRPTEFVSSSREQSERRRSVSLILDLFSSICCGVRHAHQRGVIHRDLKPQNILVDQRGTPHLLDFGLARLTGAPAGIGITQTGCFLGTYAYAAPEQVTPGGEIDVRTDVYALGVILYELLTGHLPYGSPRSAPYEFTRLIREKDATPASQHRKEINSDIDAIVLKSLVKDPNRRYGSAADLLDDIELHQHGFPINARRDSTIYVISKIAQRNKMPIASGLIFFALMVAFASALKINNDKRKSNELLTDATTAHRITQGRAIGGIDGEDILWEELLLRKVPFEEPTFASPDKPTMAYWALWEVYSRNPCLWTGLTEGRCSAVAFIREEEALRVLAQQTQKIDHLDPARVSEVTFDLRIPSLKGTSSEIAEGHKTPALRLSPNGRYATYSDEGHDLYVYDFDRSEEIGPFSGHANGVRGVAWHPSSTRLASMDLNGTVRVWGLDKELKGKIETLTNPADNHLRGKPQTASLAFGPESETFLAWAFGEGTWGAGWGQASLRRKHDPCADGYGRLTFLPSGGIVRSRPGPSGLEIVTYDSIDDVNPKPLPSSRSPLPPKMIHVSPNGTRIACRHDYTVHTWSRQAPSHFSGHDLPTVQEHTGSWILADSFEVVASLHGGLLAGLAFSASGTMATVTSQGEVRTWDLDSFRCFSPLQPQDPVLAFNSVDWSPKGEYLAISGENRETGQGILEIWKDSQKIEIEVPDRHDTVSSVAFSPSRPLLAAACHDGQLLIINVDDHSVQTRRLHHQEQQISSLNIVRFSPQGTRLAVGNNDGSHAVIWLFPVNSNDPATILGRKQIDVLHDAGGYRVPHLSFSPDGKFLAFVVRPRQERGSSKIEIVELEDQNERDSVLSSSIVRVVEFSPCGNFLAWGCDDGTITIRDLRSKTDVPLLGHHRGAVFSLAYVTPHPGKALLVGGDTASGIHLWDPISGAHLACLLDPRAPISDGGALFAFAVLPDGHRFASISDKGTAGVWDLDYYRRHINGNLEFQLQRVGKKFDLDLRDPVIERWRDWIRGPEPR